ncbi:MAG: hypothetical protein HOB73_16485 [Planctomycetaceae bacterium]|nr:hypothetical protein [Planctomycetaceae bacterium]
MQYKQVVVSCLALVLLSGGMYQTHGQEGLPSAASPYYQPRVAINYPLLAGNRVSASEPITEPMETVVGELGQLGTGCGCGIPLLPALAQGLRDTLDCIFPCRGMNRGRGLFFSERFYGANCHGCERVSPGVIYESGTIGVPTPAKPIEEVPAIMAPATSSVLPSPAERFPVVVPIGNGVRTSMVRPVQYSAPSLPTTRGVSTIPNNPLRR